MKWNTALKLVEDYSAKNVKLVKTSPVFPGWAQFILGDNKVKVTISLTAIIAELYSFTVTRIEDNESYVFFNERCAKRKIHDIISGFYNVVDTELKYKACADEQFIKFHSLLEKYVNCNHNHTTKNGTELSVCA